MSGDDQAYITSSKCLHCRGATPQDYRILPRRIILVRHAESEGNIDNFAYTYVPDPQVPLVRSVPLLLLSIVLLLLLLSFNL